MHRWQSKIPLIVNSRASTPTKPQEEDDDELAMIAAKEGDEEETMQIQKQVNEDWDLAMAIELDQEEGDVQTDDETIRKAFNCNVGIRDLDRKFDSATGIWASRRQLY